MICCAVHSAVGCAVTLKCTIRRRSWAWTTNTKENPICSRGNHEEVDGRDLGEMIVQKSAPGLRRWSGSRTMYLAIVVSQTSMPNLSSSP